MPSQANATMIHQQREHVAKLLEILRRHFADVPSRAELSDWLRDACDSYDAFRAHFLRLMALEEKDGYPSWLDAERRRHSARIERLRREHTELMRLMDSLHRDLHAAQPTDGLIIRHHSTRIAALLDTVEAHCRAETALS